MPTMLFRLTLFLCALLSLAAERNKDSNQLILEDKVTATFEFNGKYQRIWSVHVNQEYFNSSLEDRRFFYEPVMVPFVSSKNLTSVILYTDPSVESADRHNVKLIINTNDSEVHNMAYHAVKKASKTGTEIKKSNVQPLPIMNLNLTLSGLYQDPSNSDRQCCFTKTFENPGPTVELVIATDSEDKAKQIARLLENDYILYSMSVDLDRKIKRQTVTCKNGKVEVFGFLKGSMNLAYFQSQRLLSVNEQLQKDVEMKEKALKNGLKEITDKEEGFQTKIKHMQDMIVELTEDKAKINEEMVMSNEQLTILSKKVCSLGTAACFHNICSCYVFFGDKRSYLNSLAECKMFGYELASIHSHQENSFIHKRLGPNGEGDYWIGFNSFSQDRIFRWSDGTSLDFTWFAQGQSNTTEGRCGEIRSSGKWYNYNCSMAQRAICKKRL